MTIKRLALTALLAAALVFQGCGDSSDTPPGSDSGGGGGADSGVASADSGGGGGADSGGARADSGGGGGADSGGGGGFASFKDLYDKVFVAMNCANGYCHGTPSGKGGLPMTNADATYTALVGVVSKSPNCSGRTRVVAGKPEESLLLLKLTPGKAPCGKQMPPNGATPLAASVRDAIRAWIAAGAKR